ncbi:kinase-like protein [Daldinia loculata]|uniref:kinase-like protein n=1 Tax=Daldinia loculata TaxID=103429 RepID=UPI0020C3B392|nr:kinase-like protein [Daldinia loculata]KAI1651043.1 kinase-like protein [Daldinia loculata]
MFNKRSLSFITSFLKSKHLPSSPPCPSFIWTPFDMSTSTPILTGEGQPLRSVLKQDDELERPSSQNNVTSTKAVQIAEPEPDQDNLEEIHPKRQYSAGLAKRLSGRPPMLDHNSSRTSLQSQNSLEPQSSHTRSQSPHHNLQDGGRSHSHHHHQIDRFVAQVSDWLEHERVKRQNRRSRRVHSNRRKGAKDDADKTDTQQPSERARAYSIDSQSSDTSFDRLQKIVDDGMSALGLHGIPHYSSKLGKKLSRKRSVTMHRPISSDTEYHDGDILVPACDAVLDNSKTLGYSGGKPSSTDDVSSSSRKEGKERRAWITFKNEIIKLTHTLRLKGWRRVPLDSGESIDVTRLSGALTNAVYVVSPPDNIMMTGEGHKKTPAKLLLRIYGPQADQIIDRENELNVLRRLAKKKIGPRLLGTFTNGRFEQYLNAVTLTADDIRDPDTSKQIAKRMRELHDGIELLDRERDGGPMVLKNWDTWLNRTSRVITYLDRKILSGNPGPVKGPADTWKLRGLVCGVEWAVFKELVDKYRRFLNDYYGGSRAIRESLVFAHSDTQYGNILRVRPDDKKSPLLQPHYEHKQLVVIDFEYSAANTRGLEFANHFTEWCYNYHNEDAPFACDTTRYPTPEEQRRFIRAYVNHRPDFPHPGASTPNRTPLATPTLQPSTPGLAATSLGSTSSIREFMLDSRAPPGGWKEEDRRREEQAGTQVDALVEETRIWRVANSAHWVAWGIMQAKIPGFDENAADDVEGAVQPTAIAAPEEEVGDAAEFDYLAYAQDRAMFFLGDCVKMGLVTEEDLPQEVRGKLKYVDSEELFAGGAMGKR